MPRQAGGLVNRRSFLAHTATAASCASLSGAVGSAKRPPNLLFIIVDELRFDMLAAYGNERIRMPHLNRLASQSFVFEKAYVSQPVCAPSRSTILTGTFPHSNRVTMNGKPMRDGLVTLPGMVQGDYAKAYFGRSGVSDANGRLPGREVNEFADFDWPPDNFLHRHGVRPVDGATFSKIDRTLLPEHLCGPRYLADVADHFIRRNQNQPLVLYCSFYEPHPPNFGPFNHLYSPEEIILPPNFDALLKSDQPLKAHLEQRWLFEHGEAGMPIPLRTEHDWRVMIARYWGLCTLVDKYVGQILASMKTHGLLGNTLIVVTSDHGTMMGSHRLTGKNVMFEESVRVPLLVHLPGQASAKKISQPFSQIDLVPTILELMAQPVPEQCQGKSWRSILENGANNFQARDVMIQWNDVNAFVSKDAQRDPLPAYLADLATSEKAKAALADPVRTMITTDGWKLNCSPIGEHELYDLNHDPGETTNLVARAEHRNRVRELRERMGQWQRATGDAVTLPDSL